MIELRRAIASAGILLAFLATAWMRAFWRD